MTTKVLKKPHSSRWVGGAEKKRHTKRCREMGRHREMQRHGVVQRVVPHSHVVDKNLEGYFRSKGFQPHIRPPSPGFECHEDKYP